MCSIFTHADRRVPDLFPVYLSKFQKLKVKIPLKPVINLMRHKKSSDMITLLIVTAFSTEAFSMQTHREEIIRPTLIKRDYNHKGQGRRHNNILHPFVLINLRQEEG